MPKLNQIVAVEKGVKGRTANAITAIYHRLQKPALYAGLLRKYTPLDDEGDRLPPESTRVQHAVETDLENVSEALTKLFDVVATKEAANTVAKADLKMGDHVLVADASVPYLLFLEKQLVDLRTLVSKVPLLDPAETWSSDPANGGFRTEAVETTRTRKIPKVLVKYEATDKHPAQTEVYMVDEIVGRWAATKYSGAMSVIRRDVILSRIEGLMDAVKQAREEANGVEVEQQKVGSGIFEFLLAQ